MSTRIHCDVCDGTIPMLAERHYLTTKTILPVFDTAVELCSDCGRAVHEFLRDRKASTEEPPSALDIADEYAAMQAAKNEPECALVKLRYPAPVRLRNDADGYRLKLTHRDIGRFYIDIDYARLPQTQPTLMCACSSEPVLHIDGHSLGDVLLSAEGHRCETTS